MITLTNSFHNAKITIRAAVGDLVSISTYNRVRRALCGVNDCECGKDDGTRDSRYGLELVESGKSREVKALVVDYKG